MKLITLTLALVVVLSAAASASPAAEYAQHFAALSQLAVAVAQAMPVDQYSFRPHPESMTFGELMMHIASTDYAFCAGLKDTDPPADPKILATDKDAVVKFLSDSFNYCSGVIPKLSDDQLSQPHNSPDGRLAGREILLAMYIHVAHHRGQAEIYLRDKGIRPPSYRI
ncbi:MAG TPA: DinB family protein [Candidatus Dormibacteraeota bacterium]|nr:DinB family protein [Candidatus Dormibacteraeota bacterium]